MGVAESDIDVTDGPMNRVEVDLTGGPTVMTFAMEDGQARALTFEGHAFLQAKLSVAQTLRSSGWLFAFAVSMPCTTLKGWPGRTQAITPTG